MKKLAIVCAVVLAAIATSCAPSSSCYSLTVEVMGITSTTYVYGDDAAVELAKAEWEKQGLEVKVEKVDKAQADCK
jgi:ABC-type glycerol-3-phosphate transport system substrate-binding protein